MRIHNAILQEEHASIIHSVYGMDESAEEWDTNDNHQEICNHLRHGVPIRPVSDASLYFTLAAVENVASIPVPAPPLSPQDILQPISPLPPQSQEAGSSSSSRPSLGEESSRQRGVHPGGGIYLQCQRTLCCHQAQVLRNTVHAFQHCGAKRAPNR